MNLEMDVTRPEEASDSPRSGGGLTAAQVRELHGVVEELVHILAAPEHFDAAERDRVLQHACVVFQATAPHLGTLD